MITPQGFAEGCPEGLVWFVPATGPISTRLIVVPPSPRSERCRQTRGSSAHTASFARSSCGLVVAATLGSVRDPSTDRDFTRESSESKGSKRGIAFACDASFGTYRECLTSSELREIEEARARERSRRPRRPMPIPREGGWGPGLRGEIVSEFDAAKRKGRRAATSAPHGTTTTRSITP